MENRPGGRIVVSGGAFTVFNEDVVNNGIIHTGTAGDLVSTIIFFGEFSGDNGVSGSGHVFIEGDARPGNSPGAVFFGGDVSFGPFSGLEIEIGGTLAGSEYDRLDVAGHLELGGELTVKLIGGFEPSGGQRFDIWAAGSASGDFDGLNLPPLPEGLYWRTSDVEETGEIHIALVAENFAAFAEEHGLTGGPGDDDDEDGVPNIFEYLLAGSPTTSDGENLPPVRLKTDEGEVAYSFLVAHPATDDVDLEVQRAGSLGGAGEAADWAVLASRTDGAWSGLLPVTVTPTGDGYALVEVRDPNADDSAAFYRMVATHTP